MADTQINFDIFEAEKHLNNEKNSAPQNGGFEKENKIGKKKKLCLIAGIAAAILIAAVVTLTVYPLVSVKHNPEKFVKRYAEAVSEQDWDSAFEFLPAFDSPYITREAFYEYISAHPDDIPLAGAEAKSILIEPAKADGDMLYYTADYLDGSGNWQTAGFKVKRMKDGFWKYDTYRIIPSEKLICRAHICAPEGTKLFINSVEVASAGSEKGMDPKTGKEVSYAVFDSDYMIAGEYEIQAQCSGFQEYTQTVSVNSENEDFYISYKISEDAFQALFETAKSAVGALYDHACGTGNGIDRALLSSDFGQNGINALYDEISSSLACCGEYVKVSDFSITGAELKSSYGEGSETAYNSGGECAVNFSFDYTYKISNTFENTSENRDDTGYASVKFLYENNKWVIDDLAVRAIF